jgi:hypothetical protein
MSLQVVLGQLIFLLAMSSLKDQEFAKPRMDWVMTRGSPLIHAKAYFIWVEMAVPVLKGLEL